MKGFVASGVSVRSGSFRLGPLDVAIAPAGVCTLLGPAGSGKSLLAEAVAGFHPVASGRLVLAGSDLSALPPEARRIGLVPPGGALFRQLTVRGNVAFGARRRGGAWEDRVRRALAQTGAGDLAERRPAEISPPERVRVSLARALASAPELLVLDDPLAGLDPPDRRDLLALFVRLLPRTGLPALYTTRDPLDLAALGGDAVLVRRGQVVQTGPSAALLSYPASAWAARCVGFENVLPGWVMGQGPDGLTVAAGRGILALPEGPELPRGQPVVWALRAASVAIEPGRGGGANRLACRVQQASFDGSLWRLRLDCGGPLLADVRPEALPPTSAGLPPRPGDLVTAVLPVEQVRLWPCEPGPAGPPTP